MGEVDFSLSQSIVPTCSEIHPATLVENKPRQAKPNLHDPAMLHKTGTILGSAVRILLRPERWYNTYIFTLLPTLSTVLYTCIEVLVHEARLLKRNSDLVDSTYNSG